jgi:hypothetical protein
VICLKNVFVLGQTVQCAKDEHTHLTPHLGTLRNGKLVRWNLDLKNVLVQRLTPNGPVSGQIVEGK